jgi:ubiquinol-cytochrome c reductase cytochrome b subunit
LDRPRDAPWRTAIGAALFTWIALVFVAGSADRIYVTFFVSYNWQIWIYRVAVWALPVVVLFVTRRVCLELQASDRVERQRKLAEEEARRAALEPVP